MWISWNSFKCLSFDRVMQSSSFCKLFCLMPIQWGLFNCRWREFIFYRQQTKMPLFRLTSPDLVTKHLNRCWQKIPWKYTRTLSWKVISSENRCASLQRGRRAQMKLVLFSPVPPSPPVLFILSSCSYEELAVIVPYRSRVPVVEAHPTAMPPDTESDEKAQGHRGLRWKPRGTHSYTENEGARRECTIASRHVHNQPCPVHMWTQRKINTDAGWCTDAGAHKQTHWHTKNLGTNMDLLVSVTSSYLYKVNSFSFTLIFDAPAVKLTSF